MAPVNRDEFAEIIKSECKERAELHDAEARDAALLATELETRLPDRTPVIINFEDGKQAISRVVWLHFTGGELRFDPSDSKD